MTLFRLDASILGPFSATRALGDIVEAEWNSANPDSPVVRRDLVADPIPLNAWPAAVSAGRTPESDRSPAQQDAVVLAATLADELLNASALLLDVPLYNYGVSQHFKTWFDLVYTDPRTGPKATALRGKPVVLVTALGGLYDAGAPKEGWDHSTGWLTRVLVDVWGLDLHLIKRPLTLVGVNPDLDRFAGAAAAFKAAAEEASARYGRDIAERATTATTDS